MHGQRGTVHVQGHFENFRVLMLFLVVVLFVVGGGVVILTRHASGRSSEPADRLSSVLCFFHPSTCPE